MSQDPNTRLNAALEGRYRIERELGEGGMATVFLADDLRHERKVALKVLKPELAAVVGAERFLTEIKTTANLQHPHILPLFDSGEADSFLFYVTPFVEGESLRDRLDRDRQLPVDEAVQIARNVAEALHHAHSRGVIHRDIKPANVLLQDGKPIVSDFGIALAVTAGGADRLTETGLSLGTPHYMSPEQATGDQSVGPATDVYALGCVLYEMLVGEPPYTGSTPQAILGKIIAGDLASPVRQRASVPPHVDASVRKSLERIPADRFRSADELAGALTDPNFRHGADPALLPGKRRVAIAAAVGALLIGGFLGGAFAGARAGGEGEPVRQFSIILPRQDLTEGGQWGVQPIAATRELLVYRAPESVEGLDESSLAALAYGELWVRTLSDPRATRLEDTRGAEAVFLSPRGDSVGFYDEIRGEIRAMAIAGGPPATVIALEESPFLGGDWGPDGTVVYAVRSGLWSVPATGGAPRRLTEAAPADGVQHRQPRVLPGGGGVVFTLSERGSGAGGDRIAVRLDGSETEVLTEGHTPHVTEAGHLIFARGQTYGDVSLWAARLGASRAALEAQPARIVGDVAMGGAATGRVALYALADDGTLFFIPDDIRNVVDLHRAGLDGRFTPLIDVDNPQLLQVASLGHPRISPGGDRLAFLANFESGPRRPFVYDLRRGVLSGFAPSVSGGNSAWARDGERLVIDRITEGGTDLAVVQADGSGAPRPLIDADRDEKAPYELSPDGRLLVFGRDPPGEASGDLWVVPVDGSGEPRPVVATPAHEMHATLSPDGRWMAYISDESGQTEVYVTEFPESRTRRVISTGVTGAAFAPIWRDDTIFYLTEQAMMSVRVPPGPELEPDVPQRLFATRIFVCCGMGKPHDVSAEGDWLVWIWPNHRGVVRVEVIENWMAQVAARLGP